MSLIKSLSKLQLNNEMKRRDSFCDRVCDDLSEVILQFLPIKDKFRFECVDKKFQRNVFEKHHHLTVENVMHKSLKSFETLIKKLPNIMSLSYPKPSLSDEEIEVIIKNCNHLIELKTIIDLSKNSTQIVNSLFDRFGPQFTVITFYDITWKSIINSWVNIQEINVNLIYFDFNNLIDFYTQTKAKNLKRISIGFSLNPSVLQQLLDIQTKYFQTFIDNNRGITHLSLIFDGYFYEPFDPNLRYISRLSQLISLRIESNIKGKSFFKSFKSDLKQIAVNCNKLKSLSLGFKELIGHLKTNDFIPYIKKFKELKRFEFEFNDYLFNVWENKNYFMNSLNTGFKELTHLTIDLDFCDNNENSLDSIDTNLPNLQKLIIRHPIRVTERTAIILSRLSKLEVLELNIKSNKEKDFLRLFKEKILEKCRKIKSIKLCLHRFS